MPSAPSFSLLNRIMFILFVRHICHAPLTASVLQRIQGENQPIRVGHGMS